MNTTQIQVAWAWLRARTELARRDERGAGAVEYLLILIGAVAICGVAIYAVTQYVQNKGDELNGGK